MLSQDTHLACRTAAQSLEVKVYRFGPGFCGLGFQVERAFELGAVIADARISELLFILDSLNTNLTQSEEGFRVSDSSSLALGAYNPIRLQLTAQALAQNF